MPNRLHPAKWGPRSTVFDDLVKKLLDERGYGAEREYVGIMDEDRAKVVRQGIRNAGRHLGVSIKAFWKACPGSGCRDGGQECRYHVSFTAYDPAVARAYKEAQAQGNK